MIPEPARAQDLPAIRALLELNQLPVADLGPAQLQHFIVLRDGGELRGVAGLEVHGQDGLLRSVAVAPAHRSSGCGATLVAAVDARARMLRLRALYLLTTTAADYFARRGYRPVERQKVPLPVQSSTEFSALCPSSAACMIKLLN